MKMFVTFVTDKKLFCKKQFIRNRKKTFRLTQVDVYLHPHFKHWFLGAPGLLCLLKQSSSSTAYECDPNWHLEKERNTTLDKN